MDLPSREERARLAREAAAMVFDWIANTAPGASEIYHEGFLFRDRAQNPEAAAVATALYKAYEQGFVLLTQRRIGEGRYQYIATRTSRRSPVLRRAA